jgi:hypothetical protein
VSLVVLICEGDECKRGVTISKIARGNLQIAGYLLVDKQVIRRSCARAGCHGSVRDEAQWQICGAHVIAKLALFVYIMFRT